MALLEIEFEPDDGITTQELKQWIAAGRQRIELYWDHFSAKPLPQYIECDFDYVAQALAVCVHRKLADGTLFCEWGCGFGIVTGIAAILGFEAIGVEAEEFLCRQASELLVQNRVSAEIWQGNFLPRGARQLAVDEDPLVSLTHSIEPAYDQNDMSINDFALIFVYPWPGEEHFLKSVFHRFARVGALLLLYRGPYQMELYRKTSSRKQASASLD